MDAMRQGLMRQSNKLSDIEDKFMENNAEKKRETMAAVPGWLSWLSVRLSAQVMISRFMGSSPGSGSVLTAWSLKPASDSVSPSLSAPSLLVLFSLSQK